MTLYFSRLTLKRDPSTDALRQLIDPTERARATDAHHRLLWSVFSDDAGRKRDFLWRSEPRGRFYTLSERPPEPHGLFEPPEIKAFAPALSAGDRLAFLMRANAVTQKPKDPNDRAPNGELRRRKVDVAMHALRHLPGREHAARPGSAHEMSPRQAARFEIARAEAHRWLVTQGMANGFRPDPLPKGDEAAEPDAGFELEHYFTVALPGSRRGGRRGEPRFGVFEMKGRLTVTDPAAFLARLATGFGRAKSYGCGLMLIRRA